MPAKKVKCTECKGKGKFTYTCDSCDGSGRNEKGKKCGDCGGKGKIKENCRACDGDGYVLEYVSDSD